MASFPTTLFSYEIALDDALRRKLGAGVDRFPTPDPREISEAFFRKEAADELAARLIESNRFRPESPKEKEPSSDSGIDDTMELF